MSTRSATFYWATCDGVGCTRDTRDDDNTVYDDESKLRAQFDDGPKPFEADTLIDSYGWVRDGDKHYCPDHSYFDDDTETRLPLPAGRLNVAGKDAA